MEEIKHILFLVTLISSTMFVYYLWKLAKAAYNEFFDFSAYMFYLDCYGIGPMDEIKVVPIIAWTVVTGLLWTVIYQIY